MLETIKELLLKIISDIDAGNSNISEGEALRLINEIREFTNKEQRLSKYSACQYLNISRSSFDNFIKEGKIPNGKKEIGFKELSWSKKDLDKFLNLYKK